MPDRQRIFDYQRRISEANAATNFAEVMRLANVAVEFLKRNALRTQREEALRQTPPPPPQRLPPAAVPPVRPFLVIPPRNDFSTADKDPGQTPVEEAATASLLEEILMQASDPETCPEILSTLSNHQEKEVCRRVAENPNTPEKVLKRLWIRYPLAMLVNPIVAFRFLEGSNSFSKDLPTEVRLALYEALCSEGRFSEMEEQVPKSTRCDWFNQRLDYIVKTKVAPFSDVPNFLTRLYGHIAVDPCSTVRKLAARDLHSDFVLPMATDEDFEVRLELAERASNNFVGVEVCEILSRDPSVAVRKLIAHSKFLPSSAHERLAEDPSRDVRLILAKKGGCIGGEEGGWRTLATDEDVEVRLALAERVSNELAEGKIYEILSRDPSVAVRKLIAHSKFLPSSAHERLAEDPSRDVRVILAKKGGCIGGEEGGWRTLATDEDVEVRLVLAERVSNNFVGVEVCEILSRDPSAAVRKVIAHSRILPSSVHEKLAEDPSRDVRFILAKESGCIGGGEGGWRTLVEDGKELSVLVASNKYCPKSVLIDLLSHSAADVRLSAWKNYPFEKEETRKETKQLNALLAGPSRVKERMVVAANPTITGKIVRRLLAAEAEVKREMQSNHYISNLEVVLYHPYFQ